MRYRTSPLLLALAAVGLLACSNGSSSSSGGGTIGTATSGSAGSSTATGSGSGGAAPAAESGVLKTLTYNVAGLPQGMSWSNPATNTIQMSPLLNAYDLVLAQEDFVYHPELAQLAQHPYQSVPQRRPPLYMNDGLNRFSSHPFRDHYREQWLTCFGVTASGADCLAEKGFSVAIHEVTPGAIIHVYNHHGDAGGDRGDLHARQSNFDQLAWYINTFSVGVAVMVGGDTNLHGFDPDDEPTLQHFMAQTGLEDAARTLGAPEHIDRLLYRSSLQVTLTPVGWRVADEFVDPAGQDLSDHKAIHVDFEWRYDP